MSDPDSESKRHLMFGFIDMSNPDSQEITVHVEPAAPGALGPTLDDLRKQLDGAESGEVREPLLGTRHHIDLSRWAHLPPETRFRFAFEYTPTRPDRSEPSDLIDALLIAVLPASQDRARTQDELLDCRLPTQVEPLDSDASDPKIYMRSVREALQDAGLYSSALVTARLDELVSDGRAMSRGRTDEPKRYWTDIARGLPSHLRSATEEERDLNLGE